MAGGRVRSPTVPLTQQQTSLKPLHQLQYIGCGRTKIQKSTSGYGHWCRSAGDFHVIFGVEPHQMPWKSPAPKERAWFYWTATFLCMRRRIGRLIQGTWYLQDIILLGTYWFTIRSSLSLKSFHLVSTFIPVSFWKHSVLNIESSARISSHLALEIDGFYVESFHYIY